MAFASSASQAVIDALEANNICLECSKELALFEYQASILFAMAECSIEQRNIDEAARFALLTQQQAEGSEDEEPKSAMNDFQI